MDTPITRAEHEEFRKTVNSEFDRLREEDKRLNARMKSVEEDTDKINSIVVSVEKMATSIQTMTKEMEQQGKRLVALENRDGEKWRSVTGYVITAIIGIIVGFIFTQIGF